MRSQSSGNHHRCKNVTIRLPEFSHRDSKSLDHVIATRRSCRKFSYLPVTIDDLSRLLWSAQGLTGAEGGKVAPSAGAQYPLQLFIVAGNAKGLPAGLYRYHSQEHSLDLLNQVDLRFALTEAALGEQPWIHEAAVLLIVTADFDAMNSHFHDQPPIGARGERYIFMETGAVTQNVYLEAIDCSLGAVLVGGFDDGKVKKVLDLPEGVLPTAIMCVGHER